MKTCFKFYNLSPITVKVCLNKVGTATDSRLFQTSTGCLSSDTSHITASLVGFPQTIMSKSSLSSMVSTLVRASMGSAVSEHVADEDLDRHIAGLLLQEAKQKGDRYNKDGIRAYLNSGAYV